MADRTEKLDRRAPRRGPGARVWGARLSGSHRLGTALRIVPRLVLLATILWALTGPVDRVPQIVGAAGVGGSMALPGAAVQAAPFFQETGYAVAEGPIANYFIARGGVRTFGPPVSNQFPLLGTNIQIFRDHVLKVEPNGAVSTVNLFAMGAIPFRNVGGRIIPEIDQGLMATAPKAGTPNYGEQVQAFIQANAPDTWEGAPVGFYQAFLKTVSYEDAFPSGGERSLLPGFSHEVWGVPLSRPVRDAQNPDYVLLRWERGVMVWNRQSGAVSAVPLGETFKAVLTGQGLGPERTAAASGSPFLLQLNPASPNGVARPGDLPNTLLANAFTQGNAAVSAAQLTDATPTATTAPAPPPPTATTAAPAAPAPAAPAPAPPAAPAAPPPPPPTATLAADPCWGDEQITYSPDLPRAGNELLIAVTSSRPHPYGRLAGTEKTTFVRERPGQKGYVWEWTVQLTHAAKHEYTFYVDSTIPCKKLEVQVRASLATRTPTPTKTATPYGWNGNGNSNNNNNGNGNDNNAIAPRINPQDYIKNSSGVPTYQAPGTVAVDWHNCGDFTSQANAQSVLRYNTADPNRLDAEDGVEDGIACTTHTYSNYPDDDDYTQVARVYPTATATLVPTATLTPTPRPFVATDFIIYTNGVGQDAYSCSFFAQPGRGQYQAQAVLRADPRDPNKLDSNRDGYACGGVESAADGVAGGFMPGPYDQVKVPRP